MTRYADPEVQERHEQNLRGLEETRANMQKIASNYRQFRLEAIREAAAAGLTHAAIARATNLSRSRVGQILEER